MLTTTLYHLDRLSILKLAQLACLIHGQGMFRGLNSNFGGIFWSLEMGCFFGGGSPNNVGGAGISSKGQKIARWVI